MRGHPDIPELLKQELGDAVVEDAFALDLVPLLIVEGGRIILEMLDERARLRAFIEDLGLAFIDAAATIDLLGPLATNRLKSLTKHRKRGPADRRPARECYKHRRNRTKGVLSGP